jgi:hypothetical protein
MHHARPDTDDDHHNEQQLLHCSLMTFFFPQGYLESTVVNSKLRNADNLQGLDSSLILLKCYTER